MSSTSDRSQRRIGVPGYSPESATPVKREAATPPRQAWAAGTPLPPVVKQEPIEHCLYGYSCTDGDALHGLTIETSAECLRKQRTTSMSLSETLRGSTGEPKVGPIRDPTGGTGALGRSQARLSPVKSENDFQAQEEEEDVPPPTLREAVWLVLDMAMHPERRLAVYKAWCDHHRVIHQEWIDRGKPFCTPCNTAHPGDCLDRTDLDRQKALRKEGKKLQKAADANAAKQAVAEAKQSRERAAAEAEKKAKQKARQAYQVPPCPVCARLHRGTCRYRPCVRCGRAHQFQESCADAKTRFEEAGLVETEPATTSLDDSQLRSLAGVAANLGDKPSGQRLFADIMGSIGEQDSLRRIASKIKTEHGANAFAAMLDLEPEQQGQKRKADSHEDDSKKTTKVAKRFRKRNRNKSSNEASSLSRE